MIAFQVSALSWLFAVRDEFCSFKCIVMKKLTIALMITLYLMHHNLVIGQVSKSPKISLTEVEQEKEISLESLRGLRIQYGAASEEYKSALNEINTRRNK